MIWSEPDTDNHKFCGFHDQQTNAVRIYPNPSGGLITVELTEVSSNMEFRVVSVVGVSQQIIKLANTMKQEVDLEGVGQGIYSSVSLAS